MGNKSLEEMSDDELLQLHAQEVGLDNLSDDQLMRLTELEESQPPPQQETGGLGKAFVKSLPMAGGVLGGGLGGLAGGVGAIPGAAFGAATGKAAQTALENLIYNQPKSRAEIYGGPAVEALSAGLGEASAPEITRLAVKGAGALGSTLKKTASNLSMIPEKVLETYSKRIGDVEKIPMDVESPIAQAVQGFRERALNLKDQFMNVRNAKIAQALKEKGSQLVDVQPIINFYEETLAKMPQKYGAEQRARVATQLDILKNAANENGQLEAAELFQMQRDLDQLANYMPASQELKKAKDFADVTFMRAAGKARQITGRVMPEAREAMKEISQLRRVGQNRPILNMLDVNKPYSPLMGVGSGENQQNIMNLRRLGNVLGEDLVGQAENIAAAQYMGNAGILPNIKTGARTPIIGTALTGLGYLEGGKIGAAIPAIAMTAVSSPLAIKTAIKGAAKIRAYSPDWSKQMIEQLIQGAIQQGITPTMMDSFVKKSDLTNYEKAITRKQITEGQ